MKYPHPTYTIRTDTFHKQRSSTDLLAGLVDCLQVAQKTHEKGARRHSRAAADSGRVQPHTQAQYAGEQRLSVLRNQGRETQDYRNVLCCHGSTVGWELRGPATLAGFSCAFLLTHTNDKPRNC